MWFYRTLFITAAEIHVSTAVRAFVVNHTHSFGFRAVVDIIIGETVLFSSDSFTLLISSESSPHEVRGCNKMRDQSSDQVSSCVRDDDWRL